MLSKLERKSSRNDLERIKQLRSAMSKKILPRSRLNSELLYAAEWGLIAYVGELLEKGADINVTDIGRTCLSYTPLIWAAKGKHVGVVKILLKWPDPDNQVDIYKKTNLGKWNTALHWAVISGSQEIVEALLDHAEKYPNPKENAPKLINEPGWKKKTPLHLVVDNLIETISDELKSKKEEQSIDEDFLNSSIFRKDMLLMALLLKRGADKELRDAEKMTVQGSLEKKFTLPAAQKILQKVEQMEQELSAEDKKARFFQFLEANENFPTFLYLCTRADPSNEEEYHKLYLRYKDIYQPILLGTNIPPYLDKQQAENDLDWAAKQSEELLLAVQEYNEKLLEEQDRLIFYQSCQAQPGRKLADLNQAKLFKLTQLFGGKISLEATLVASKEELEQSIKLSERTMQEHKVERQLLIDRGSFITEIVKRCTDALNIEKVVEHTHSAHRIVDKEFIESCRHADVAGVQKALEKGYVSQTAIAEGLQINQTIMQPLQQISSLLGNAINRNRMNSSYIKSQAHELYENTEELLEGGEEIEEGAAEGSSAVQMRNYFAGRPNRSPIHASNPGEANSTTDRHRNLFAGLESTTLM